MNVSHLEKQKAPATKVARNAFNISRNQVLQLLENANESAADDPLCSTLLTLTFKNVFQQHIWNIEQDAQFYFWMAPGQKRYLVNVNWYIWELLRLNVLTVKFKEASLTRLGLGQPARKSVFFFFFYVHQTNWFIHRKIPVESLL